MLCLIGHDVISYSSTLKMGLCRSRLLSGNQSTYSRKAKMDYKLVEVEIPS